MLTLLVRISLVAELAAYVLLGTWLHARHGWSVAEAAAAAVALALALRLALVLLTGGLGWVCRSPRAPAHRLGAIGTARLVFGEYLAMLADNFFYIPFENLAVRPDPVPSPGGRVPVMLVHGYLSNRGYFRAMVRHLEARGVAPIFVPDFPSAFSTIEAFTARLHAEIERVAAGTGQSQVLLVCHSMGGLAARAYLREHGSRRIARLVTIASPHHGSVAARLGIGAHARQMEPGSGFLRALAEAERSSPPQVAATSIYSAHDNLVIPQETSRLDWARNVALSGVGHVDILRSPGALSVVLEELRGAGA